MAGGTDSASQTDQTNSQLATKVRAEMRRWSDESVKPDALAFISEHQGVCTDPELVLELAYEEFCLRTDRGEQVEVQLFCQRFPLVHGALRRRIEIDQCLRKDSPQLFQDPFQWPRAGDPLLDFTVVAPMASGGFARVYLCAEKGVGDRQVVVKVARRGAFEADTMGRLSHPNIMPVLSVRCDERTGTSCLCMPFVGRSTLRHVIDAAFFDGMPRSASVILEASRGLMQRGDRSQHVTPPLTIDPNSSYIAGVLQLAVQVASALQHAHQCGVIHGDLKASNVVMSVQATPLLVDFNLSHQCDDAPQLATGGTLPFMAPEKIRAAALGEVEQDPIDIRSDIFSFGVTLFELMTGQLPFSSTSVDGGRAMDVSRLLLSQKNGAPSVQELNPMVNAGLADLIRHCLAYDPAERPQSMDQVLRLLKRELSATKRVYRFLYDRRRALVATGAVGCMALSAAISARWLLPPARDRHYQSGLRHFQSADFADAIRSFDASIQCDDQFHQAYFARACTALHARDQGQLDVPLDSIEVDLRTAGKLQPDARIFVAHAMVYLANHDFATAANSLELAIKQGIQSAAVWNNLGYAYTKLSGLNGGSDKHLLRARDAFQEAIALDEALLEPHFNFAICELTYYRSSDEEISPILGLRSIRKVVARKSAVGIYLCAAKLAGVVAEQKDDDELWEEAFTYLGEAHALGMDVRGSLGRHPFSSRGNDPRVTELASLPPRVAPYDVVRRVVLPVAILSPK